MDLASRALLGLIRIAEDKKVPYEHRVWTFRYVLEALGSSSKEVFMPTARLLVAVPLRWAEFTVQEMVPNPCGHDFDPGARYCNICGKNVEPVAKDVLKSHARNWVELPSDVASKSIQADIVASDKHSIASARLRPLTPAKDGFEWCIGVEMTGLRDGTRTFTNFTVPVISKSLEDLAASIGVHRKAEFILVTE